MLWIKSRNQVSLFVSAIESFHLQRTLHLLHKISFTSHCTRIAKSHRRDEYLLLNRIEYNGTCDRKKRITIFYDRRQLSGYMYV